MISTGNHNATSRMMLLIHPQKLPYLLCAGLFVLSWFANHSAAIDPPATPTTVDCLLSMVSLTKLNGVEQSFNADFYLTIIWEDPRINSTTLVYDPAADWSPNVEFTNVFGTPEQSVTDPWYVSATPPREIETEVPPTATGPWVVGQLRYKGQFIVDMNLRDFPFDRQSVKLKLESATFTIEDVVFRVAPGNRQRDSVLPAKFKVTEWTVLRADTDIRNIWYPVFEQTYSQFRVDIVVERDPGYYITKFVLGVAMLVIMGFMVFALEIDEPDRMMGTLSVFLGIVSFLFIASQDLPKVAYSTRIDSFMSLSFSMVFILMLVHSLNYLFFWKLSLREEHLDHKMNIKEKSEEAGKVVDNISDDDETDKKKKSRKAVTETMVENLQGEGQEPNNKEGDDIVENSEAKDVESGTDTAVSYALKTLLRIYGIKKKKHRITRLADGAAIIVLAIVYTVATAVILRGKETEDPSKE
jgi:hypothetical protein